MAGTWWTPSLTAGSFTVTVGGASATHTLSTDANGALSGSITVPAGAATGAGSVVITQAADSVTFSLSVLGARSVSASPANGRAGQSVNVTATQFDPNAQVEILGVTSLSGPVASLDPPTTTTVSSSGTLSTTPYVVTDPETVAIVVRETAPLGDPAADFASAPFSVDPVTVDIDSVTGQRSGVTGFARAGDTLVVSGSGWPSNLTSGAFTATFCDEVGDNCGTPVAATLSTDAAGGLTGTVPVPAGAATGDATLTLTNAGRSAVVTLTLLDERTVTLIGATGSAGSTVDVTGAQFDPEAAVTIRGVRSLDGSILSSDPAVGAVIDGSGVLVATSYTINDPLTVAVLVSEDAPGGDPAVDRAIAPFTVLPVAAFIDSITGQRTGVTSHARPGDVLNLGGDSWAPNLGAGDLTASLCLPDGSSCDAAASDTLVTDATGTLSGGVTVPAGSTTGARSLKVAAINGESLTPVTVLGDRTVSTASSTALVGRSFSVSVAGFDVLADIEVRGATAVGPGAPTFTTDPAVAATTDADGALTGLNYPVNDVATAFLVVYEVPPSGDSAVDNANTAVQVVVPTYTLGLRAFTSGSNPDPTTIAFGTLPSPLTPTPLPGAMNRLEVVDDRQGSFGWSLTATLDDLTGAGGATLDASALSATPSCTASGGSAPGATAGPAGQTFATLVQLCTKDAQVGPGGTTSGTYTIDTPLVLTVPAFQAADTYTGVLTITLA
jgi:hypothetical protein